MEIVENAEKEGENWWKVDNKTEKWKKMEKMGKTVKNMKK